MTTADQPGRAQRTQRRAQPAIPTPPPRRAEPIIHGDCETLQHWLAHYWQKLQLPDTELSLLALTQDRQEFRLWTGKRLHLLVLGCYCYLPAPRRSQVVSTTASNISTTHRHIIFIEPEMQPRSIEVTIAHELIHLADRVNGTPRRHRHHGYDSIAADEAAVTGYSLEDLRALLHEESEKRDQARRQRRPIRYLYQCPHCGKKYPRTRRYSQSVSCSSCDKQYNPQFRLLLLPVDGIA
jgi:predicted SprT family Zn-dependent metalloprotease